MVLTSGCHVVISRRYHTRLARMHIDPGTWVQPVNGVILILSSPLASYYFPFSILSFTPSSFLFAPSSADPSYFFPPFLSLSSAFPFPLSSLHPPSRIKLFIWPKPQPAGKQAVSTETVAEDRQLQTTLYRAGNEACLTLIDENAGPSDTVSMWT